MKNILKYVLFLAFIAGVFSSCVNSDYYPTPATILKTYEFTSTIRIQDVKAFNNSAAPKLYDADDVLEGYVSSNDKESNFYNSTSFQSVPTDGTQPMGFSVTANVRSFTKGFTPGRKAYIKLKGLYTAVIDGSLKIGSIYAGAIGRISENEWQNYMFPSALVLDENTFVKTVSLAQAADDTRLNTLIEIENIQFADASLNRTYYDIDSGGGATNHDLTSITGGTTQFFRVSSYAPFSKKQVASGSGRIRGVMTKYGTTYQFIVRDESDIKLTNPRASIHFALGGTDIQFNGTLNEPFTSYDITTTAFAKYVNDQTTGNRYWQIKQYPATTGNKYIEMSAYSGAGNPGVASKSYFFVPVNFTAANTFTFKKEIRYNLGPALKVYYVKSPDYTATGPINLSAFVDITSAFNISYPAINSSENSFNSPGTYAIPANVTGNGFFVFEYTGTSVITTTVQLDDIVVN